ncbi:MAG: KpsF/GutQ family sugar-phosphate isomerase [Candidatus Marinimicrobia bacterium]|mgnify:FL=1|jgi:arabinose-5-phosphate isomerase|nr:KpsF/GutQ family sugar-phosphate isomerase [Candidatus Neomarinimicrobiota bacterium]MBT4154599.1 KpsF/GutQ family sugar-phosphate isomerase [Candidatus Neomarinimicrobiota bacterium]MBT4752633.1 KpsF/GutQ family sugar-phosphate isomerase [Candidatus Neomarinimicrobiota bacterium]MBT5115206.1 KpsF/GutQ family sugar-phosphate isomerase [Candidatus Neomarinimicrobiota bacterium]MBT5748128.1 KpsF/GutQ family sugar-phosphate isomerase [Candidatus Neomarinimicrobiota bacterium]|tara:strand:- start:720 stop:1700 length:981 start_codon:yes stop_codon:yes gene_type:complete
MNSSNIQSVAKRVIEIEAEAVSLMGNRIDAKFESAVQSILQCSGRLIVSGMGKSGLISQKIASTMASTGTPSHFVHPAEATHGDLGMITKEDIVLIVSNSGETMELIQILPTLRKKGITIIGMIGRQNSTLSKRSDIYLDTSVEKEACTLDLAPTASTTATLAMGDALAVSLLEIRGFNKEDFAELHPGGRLGKRLLLTLDQLVHSGDYIPFVLQSASIKEALLVISEKGLGMTGVLNKKDEMVGIITDGDIRRGLENSGNDLFDQTAEFLMSKNPKSVTADTLAISALELMEKHSITSLFVYSDSTLKRPDGIVHIHDILKSGVQ